MNYFDDPLDRILAEIALRVQLPPSKHRLACERYAAVASYVERDGSPLQGRVARFYPQGSMAIDATIAARRRDEEYDIDIVAELLFAVGSDPQYVLDLLYVAIKGKPGSRYFKMVKRRTRCITIYYEDGMHLDVTPVILRPQRIERTSDLFHDDPDLPNEPSLTLLMNAWGFSEYFKQRTADSTGFAAEYARYAYAKDIHADSDAEPVDPQKDPARKSTDVVSLQLLKRHRNTLYSHRSGRMPPSVLMSKYVADRPVPGASLSESLLAHASHIHGKIRRADNLGHLVYEENPTCAEDCFTDRWPQTRADQRQYMTDLNQLITLLAQMKTGQMTIRDIQDGLIPVFGEFPVKAAVRATQERVGAATRTGKTGHKIGGGLLLGGSAAGGRSARANTNMGGGYLTD